MECEETPTPNMVSMDVEGGSDKIIDGMPSHHQDLRQWNISSPIIVIDDDSSTSDIENPSFEAMEISPPAMDISPRAVSPVPPVTLASEELVDVPKKKNTKKFQISSSEIIDLEQKTLLELKYFDLEESDLESYSRKRRSIRKVNSTDSSLFHLKTVLDSDFSPFDEE
jgi:hypothetical protein